jgi:hypothetical protein
MYEYFRQLNTLSSDDFDRAENIFRKDILADRSKMDLAWDALHRLFVDKNSSTDFVYRNSFFRWYAHLTWRGINTLNKQDFVDIAIGRQLVMGLLLSFDVWEEIVKYLGIHGLDENDVQSLYSKIKKTVFNSQEIVGKNRQGDSVTLSEVAKKIERINLQGNDSVEMAEFFTELKDIIYTFGNLDTQYFFGDPEKVIRRFVDLIHFFLGVSNDGIWVVVDSFMYPEWYSALQNQRGNQNILQPSISSDLKSVVGKKNNEDVRENLQSREQNISYISIKDQLSALYTNVSDDERVELIMRDLQKIADEYEDLRILDLYYYDEQQEKFVWNEELLTSS